MTGVQTCALRSVDAFVHVKERTHVFSGDPVNFSIGKMVLDAVYDIHALDDVSDGAEPDNEKFSHI